MSPLSFQQVGARYGIWTNELAHLFSHTAGVDHGVRMALAKRVIPVLLAKGDNLVKGTQFNSDRIIGHVQQAAEIHASRGVDELIVLDVGATPDGRGPDIKAMARLTECCFIPVSVGGGITRIEEVRELLANGADKIVIGSAAIHDSAFVQKCVDKFGSQAITVALDVVPIRKNWAVVSNCGTVSTIWDAVGYAQFLESIGVGEIILTNIKHDGMMKGYDYGLIHQVSSVLSIPLIASGGAGHYRHMLNALLAGADAVAAGAMFAWTDATPRGAAEYLANWGFEVRL